MDDHLIGAPASRSDLRAAWLLLLAGVVLPNLPYVALWVTGFPPRPVAIAAYVLLALVAPRMPAALLCVAYAGVVVMDILGVLSLTSHLAITELARAARYATRLRLWASPLYVGALLAVGASGVLAVRIMRRWGARWRDGGWVPALVGAVVLVATDAWCNVYPHYYEFGVRDDLGSAFERSGAGRAAADRRNLLLVLVEGWGHLDNPDHRKLVTEPLRSDGVLSQYEITEGWTPYQHSTTYAEMRELCGTQTYYENLTDRAALACWPARLARLGYETTSVHAFTGDMFDRRSWYPKIGFQRSLFAEELAHTGARWCNAVFAGLCDADLAGGVHDQLVRGEERPQFVYWLTLNTHVPIEPQGDRGGLGCRRGGGPVQNEPICDAIVLWRDVFSAIGAVATSDDLPPTDILIVGDHAAPVWDRAGRRLFDPGKVSWMYLRSRSKGVLPRPAHVAAVPSAG